jgi:nitrogen fixation protein NifQ
MSGSALAKVTVHAVYASLMDARRGEPVEATLACILASWSQGLGAMPDWLGLGKDGFSVMMSHHFPNYDPVWFGPRKRRIDPKRGEEIEDLRKLLMDNRSSHGQSEAWMADIVTAGCLGSDHLWQDLGLWNRAELTALMRDNFAPLARRNDKDMKWKKFLYRQLCEAEGITICRSPSCEVCVDYPDCFGSD